MNRKSSLRYPAMMGVALGLGVGLSIGAALFVGLAIVNTAVALHRGTWYLESTQGDGTTVMVQLPLE
ncbi:MAG: ATP-binding protein [Cyanobacteria bacterium J06638_6]